MADRATFGDLSSGRANNFDALRFVLAALVILSHSYPLLNGSNDCEPFFEATGGQITGGEVAVGGFFIISGFLIAQSWEKSRGLGDYLRKRIARIYPGFLAAALFCAFIAGPALSESAEEYWKQFRPARFALAALNLEELDLPPVAPELPAKSINGSLWSIRYEFVCYLALAGLGATGLIRRRWPVAVALAVCLSVQAAQIYLKIKMPGSGLSRVWCYPELWPRVAGCFFAGTLAYSCRDRIPQSGVIAALSAAILIVLAFASHLKALPLAFPVFGGYLLFWFAFLPTPRLHQFARYGDFSYGVYLYAYPVQQMLVRAYGERLTPPKLFAAALPLTLGLAIVSWFVVERPWLKRAHRRHV